MSERLYVPSERVDLVLALSRRMLHLALEARSEEVYAVVWPQMKASIAWIKEAWALPCADPHCRACQVFR